MVMVILTALLMIAAGVLAAASLIAAKKPNAKEAIDKLVPFQGIIGIISLLWGVWSLIGVIRIIDAFSVVPIRWLLALAAALVMIILGFVLGYALISKYTMKTPEAQAKGEAMRLKMVKFQVPLGIASIALGLWVLISGLTA